MKKIESVPARPSTQCQELSTLLSHYGVLKFEYVLLFPANINCLMLVTF